MLLIKQIIVCVRLRSKLSIDSVISNRRHCRQDSQYYPVDSDLY